MMSNLSKIYDREFFQEWGIHHDKYISSAEHITNVLVRHLKPKRIVDVGCGCGVYSHFFKQKGLEVVSIDGVQPPSEESYPIQIEFRDLTIPLENVWGNFDLALCLEVAEHIPEHDTDTFLKNIIQFSDTLLMSAAPPNQGGHHHVNEQPKRYWVQKLANLGFAYNRKKTGVIFETFKLEKPAYMWMVEHISLYERIKKDAPVAELPFQISHPKV